LLFWFWVGFVCFAGMGLHDRAVVVSEQLLQQQQQEKKKKEDTTARAHLLLKPHPATVSFPISRVALPSQRPLSVQGTKQ